MPHRFALLPPLALASWQALASGASCTFESSGLLASFGPLDPSQATTVTIPIVALTLNADRAGDCTGVTFTIQADDGLNYSGARRMRSAAGGSIPYTLVGVPTLPQSGPGDGYYTRFRLDARIAGSDYANARAGTYQDTVILTISP